LYKFIHSDSYYADIEVIEDYFIYELDARKFVENLAFTLEKLLRQIKIMPHSRPLVKDKYLAGKGYRSLIVKKYVVIYSLDENEKIIKLARFLDGRSDWINILKDDIEE
jgi:toxin ParE1/3/4